MRISCSVHHIGDHDLHRTFVFIVVAGFLCACNHYLLLGLCHYNHRTMPVTGIGVTFCCVAVMVCFVCCCVLPFSSLIAK